MTSLPVGIRLGQELLIVNIWSGLMIFNLEDYHYEVLKLDELGIKPIMMSFYIEEFREKSLIVHGVLQ